MIDTFDVRELLHRAIEELQYVECEEPHCEHGSGVDGSYAEEIVDEKLQRLRLGVYDEGLDGTLFEILEQIERSLK